ncbi:acyltransferase family protein [Parvibaculum sp.]|uniref:acyltransferase family protein n=1 Tax=Parvibaculum sp. TaxID=2024848 RepID=UPI00329A4738
MQYRPDVDGIRAVAVVPVVMFHAGIWPFTGGFVGVDVFFVISGYLITSILVGDIQAGNFSIARFYERRIRRIFPALFLMLGLSFIAGWFILLPSYFEDFSEGVFATALFLSNFQFWRESGYFDSAADLKPLLHTWSLAVEEQFYIFFPLLLALFYRHRLSILKAALLVVTVISFALSVYFVRSAPEAAFYLTPMRVWELMAGCLLAVGMVPRFTSNRVAEVSAAVGIALIAIAVFGFTPATPFPGVAALLPVVGTMLLIHSGESSVTTIGRILSTPVLVGIGLISYSLYLFHWPVFVFYRHLVDGGDGELGMRILLIFLSVALAWASWRYVERPFRRRAPTSTKRRVFAVGGVVAVTFLAVGGVGNAMKGWPERYDFRFDPAPVMKAGEREIRKVMEGVRCRVPGEGSTANAHRHCDEMPLRHPAVALIGDSHASHIYPGLIAEFPDVDFRLYGAGGCRVLRNVNTRESKPDCAIVGPFFYDTVLPGQKFDGVILSGRWEMADVEPLAESIEYISRYADDVVVLGPVPRYKVNLPEALAIWKGEYSRKFFDLNEDATVAGIDDALAARLAGSGATYISLYRGLCRDRKCRLFGEGGKSPLQWDKAHLTVAGSHFVASELLVPVLREHPAFAQSPMSALENRHMQDVER